MSHCCLLHKLEPIAVAEQYLSIVSQFLSDMRQRVRLDGKFTVCVDVVSGVPQRYFRPVVVYIVHLQALPPHCWVGIK